MTNPLLTRPHLEATLVALAAVQRDRAGELLGRVDRLRVSPAAVGLLEQLANTAADGVWSETVGQRELLLRVDTITVFDLFFWPVDVLLSLVNQLPERAARVSAMDIGTETAA